MINTSKDKTVFSEQRKEEQNMEQFMEYLVDSEVALSVIQYLVHLRGCDSFPEDPLKILSGHFALQTNDKMQKYKDLISEYQVLKNENQLLSEEMLQLEEKLAEEREKFEEREKQKQKQKQKEEELRLQEEANKESNNKKIKKK